MYHPVINISIFGENDMIRNLLEHSRPEDFPDFTIAHEKKFEPEIAANSDLVIFYGQSDFEAARSAVRPGALLVACLNAEEEKNLSDADKESLDDIWITPIGKDRLVMRLTHLFAEIGGRDYSSFLLGCLDTFINSLPDMVWFKDLAGVHRKVNDYFCEFVGKSREEVESSTHEEIWGIPETDEELNCHVTDQAAIDTGETVIAEEVVDTETGKRLFKTIKTPICGLGGEVLGTVGIAHDITNLSNLNMELYLFIEMIPFPLMICDLDDQITKANSKFLEFFETDLEKLQDVNWRDWYEENILHEISPTGEDIYRRFMHADGKVSFLKMVSHDMNDLFGNYMGVIHVFEDVTADKELEYNIWKLANTDALTELANRQAFYEYAKRIGRDEKIGLFYVDLDNFKQVNDIYGHKAGDEALKATAAILRQVFPGDFPARLGGDEFIVCVRREATQAELEEMAQNLVDLMKETFGADEKLSRLSCSVGVTCNGSMRDGIEPLVKMTDNAMYEAKKQGKACYRFSHAAEDEPVAISGN